MSPLKCTHFYSISTQWGEKEFTLEGTLKSIDVKYVVTMIALKGLCVCGRSWACVSVCV